MKSQTLKKNQPNSFLRYSGMATTMAVIILIGVLGGRWLDEHFQTETPWYTLTGSILGVTLSMYYIIKDLIKK